MKAEVLKFGATWCNSCVKMSPIFKEIAEEMKSDNLKFREIDVEEDEGVDLSSEYQVRNVPTILIVKDGKVAERITGTKTKNELKEIIKKWN